MEHLPLLRTGGDGHSLQVQAADRRRHPPETKCQYCTLFHSELARFFGASEVELQEAVHLANYTGANYTVGLSVYLNGTRYPLDRFERELERILEFVG